MSTTPAPPGTNLTVIVGSLRRRPEPRTLATGDTVLALELSVPGPGARESVPVAWLDPAPSASGWDAGDELLVVGRTRQRFFRTAGGTQSRTEVVADRIVPTRRRAAASKAIAAALAPLTG